MKKTLTVNLNGRVFNIDEDAYVLLEKYLENLRVYFRGEESNDEILADFEARIEELLSNRIRLGYNVINIEEVEKVIAQVGRPDDFGEENESASSSENKNQEETSTQKKLFRNSSDKMFGGVFSGLATYFGWNTLALRLIAIFLVLVTTFWIIPIYLIAWLIIPEARTVEQKLRMQGKRITVENIGKEVSAATETSQASDNQGCLGSFVNIIVVLFKLLLIGLAIIIGIPLLFSLIVIIIVLFALLFGVGTELTHSFGFLPDFASPVLTSIVLFFVIGIPLAALIYTIISYFMKLKPVHKGVKWTGLIAWITSLILLFVIAGKTDWKGLVSHIEYSTEINETEINGPVFEGNGIIENKEGKYSASIKEIQIDVSEATIQIEQIKGDSISVLVNGDANLVDKVQINADNEKTLKIKQAESGLFKCSVPLIIQIQVPEITKLNIESANNVTIPNPFHQKEIYILMKNVKNVAIDSIYVDNLNVDMKNINSVIFGGHTKNATFDLNRVKKIDMEELEVDVISSYKAYNSGDSNFGGVKIGGGRGNIKIGGLEIKINTKNKGKR